MTHLTPPKIQLPDGKEDDQRLGHFFSIGSVEDVPQKVVLIGFPSDEGVARNGGRKGAAEAPREIRKSLYKMTPDAENYQQHLNLIEHTNDGGNVRISGDLEVDQATLGGVIAEYLERDIIPVILGGGHETAFGHFLGYAKAGFRTGILNIDAHADVRPLKDGMAHSGSPFRQALEHESNCCEKYMVAGLQPHSVAQSHLEFIENYSGEYRFRKATKITTISSLFHKYESERLMVTFDMDAVDQAYAPGVSAPCTNGLPPDLWLTAAYLAGRNQQVTSFDISEVNPKYDRDGQTANLAALTVWYFLLGLSQRP